MGKAAGVGPVEGSCYDSAEAKGDDVFLAGIFAPVHDLDGRDFELTC